MTAEAFRSLHHDRAPGDPLILPGPWDAASARAFAEAGFPALATPSAGVAAALGYEDGATPADEMFAAVTRIARSVGVPVSVDVEGGYGLSPKELVARILDTGAIGCNLEDSDSATKALKNPRQHADWLAEVRAEAGDRLFINARVGALQARTVLGGGGVQRNADGISDAVRVTQYEYVEFLLAESEHVWILTRRSPFPQAS
jgi:2-methylisocitrate lyase-like PEP mutase family enzyme